MRAEPTPTFPRFDDLNAALLSREFQIHTTWTDGEGSVHEVLDAARARGLREIAFTEHARHTSTYYPDFFAEIDEAARAFPDLTVFRGFEVKIVDFEGALDISSSMRAQAEIILASVHSLPQPAGGVIHPREMDARKTCQIELDLSLGVIAAGSADVLSHAGGMSMRFHQGFPLESYEAILAAICTTDMAFEMNYSYHAPVFGELITLVQRYNPRVSVGSDVHSRVLVRFSGKAS